MKIQSKTRRMMTAVAAALLLPWTASGWAELALSVSAEKAAYELGEPVYLRVTVRNQGTAPESVGLPLRPEFGTVAVQIQRPDESKVSLPYGVMLGGGSTALGAGDSVHGRFGALVGAREVVFNSEGTYRVRARLHDHVADTTVTVSGGSDMADLMGEPAAFRAMQVMVWQTPAPQLDDGRAWLTRAIRSFPSVAFAQHARIALARSAARGFESPVPERRRAPDCGRATEWLNQMEPDALTVRNRISRTETLLVCTRDKGSESELRKQLDSLRQALRAS